MKQKPIHSQTSQRLYQHPTPAEQRVSGLAVIKANMVDVLKLSAVGVASLGLWSALTFLVTSIWGLI